MPDRSSAEFGVFEIASADDFLVVSGMCYDTPIKVSDVARAVYRLLPPNGLTLVQLAERVDVDFFATDFRNVNLVIEKIVSDGEALKELQPGKLAALYLSGSGAHLVTTKDVLGIDATRRPLNGNLLPNFLGS